MQNLLSNDLIDGRWHEVQLSESSISKGGKKERKIMWIRFGRRNFSFHNSYYGSVEHVACSFVVKLNQI